jgi:hypothetical protein
LPPPVQWPDDSIFDNSRDKVKEGEVLYGGNSEGEYGDHGKVLDDIAAREREGVLEAVGGNCIAEHLDSDLRRGNGRSFEPRRR